MKVSHPRAQANNRMQLTGLARSGRAQLVASFSNGPLSTVAVLEANWAKMKAGQALERIRPLE